MDILAFCQKRNLTTDGIKISQIVDWDKKNTDQSKVVLNIQLPSDFPEKYVKAIGKAVETCTVARLGKGISDSSFETVFTPTGSR